jgi:hypothetical protein
MRLRTCVLLSLLTSCVSPELDDTSSAVLVHRVGIQGAGACGFATVGAAIAAAANGDTILVENGHTFSERLGLITTDLTIRAGVAGCGGPSAVGTFATIDAGHLGRLAEVAADVSFEQLSLSNGHAGNGAQIGASFNAGANLWVTSGTTTLVDTTVFGGTNNVAAGDFAPYGVGVHVGSGATLVARGTSMIAGNQNSTIGAGGVLVEAGATATFEDTTRIGFPLLGPNLANQGPGGLMVMGSATLRHDVEVVSNRSSLAGGGVYIFGGTVSLFDNARVGNNLARDGGGIAVVDGELHTSANVEIAANEASEDGGGIWIQSGNLDLQGTTQIAGNDAGGSGGGVAVFGGLFDAEGSVAITDNHADLAGGGLYLTSADTEADLDGVTIASNSAARGAGLALLAGATAMAEDLVLADNIATGDGGGALVEGSATAWTMWSSDVTDNRAARGGGLFVSGGTHSFETVDLRRNQASTEGGGARFSGSTTTMTWGAVTANSATTMGGGFAVPGGIVKLFATDVLSNTATTDGGGFAIANTGRVEATDVWVKANTAGLRGGGIAVLSHAANTDPQLAMLGLTSTIELSCTYRGAIGKNEYCSDIKDNVASEGGGVYLEDGTEAITRTAIRQNVATATASALWMRDVATGAPALALSNALIVNNGNVANVDSVRVGGGIFAGEAVTSADNLGAPFRFTASAAPSLLQRSIVWDAANVLNNAATPLGATCSMFRAVTGATVGANVAFGLDPRFVTTPRGKYRLGPASVDAIDQCAIGLAFDLDSDPRPINVRFDRGAFEAQ